MKLSKLHSISKKILLGLLAFTMFATIYSCARKTTFLTSPVVPAARGSVKVKKDNNNNYNIKIKISGLAEAKRLEPAKQVYVVWLQSDENLTKNLGQINSNSGMLSKSLKASFETVTAFKPVKIYITAEDDSNVQYPGTHIILSTTDF